jgi:pimeloyl-ACP methyl ester carboxylesterase
MKMKIILFLHGWGATGESFAPVKKFFSNFASVLAPDMPCPPDTIWQLEDYVSYVKKILRQNKVTQCDIIAHSFGARVAVLLAAREPQLVGKMVIVGGAGLKPRFNLRVWLKVKLYKIFKWGKGSTDYRKLSPSGKATFNNIIRRDLAPEIAGLRVPTLLITGERDRATPPYMAKRWAKLCKTAAARIYKNCGHYAYLDSTALFIRDAEEFLR